MQYICITINWNRPPPPPPPPEALLPPTPAVVARDFPERGWSPSSRPRTPPLLPNPHLPRLPRLPHSLSHSLHIAESALRIAVLGPDSPVPTPAYYAPTHFAEAFEADLWTNWFYWREMFAEAIYVQRLFEAMMCTNAVSGVGWSGKADSFYIDLTRGKRKAAEAPSPQNGTPRKYFKTDDVEAVDNKKPIVCRGSTIDLTRPELAKERGMLRQSPTTPKTHSATEVQHIHHSTSRRYVYHQVFATQTLILTITSLFSQGVHLAQASTLFETRRWRFSNMSNSDRTSSPALNDKFTQRLRRAKKTFLFCCRAR
ncbi:hypothetical protein HYFRA_00012219 [Hymenoscyphus fraxineus]|uniref:Uncharacterized protein n=1 Tax=Hymenoscyphus fraxineus TaxID=746836 RepID=A0A9N9PUX3_9HELO|nr:hypothetical protein HYFRA_00012219 [Hymenoscyphus fraxineus]